MMILGSFQKKKKKRRKNIMKWHFRLLHCSQDREQIISKEENIEALAASFVQEFFSGLIKHVAQKWDIVYIEELLPRLPTRTPPPEMKFDEKRADWQMGISHRTSNKRPRVNNWLQHTTRLQTAQCRIPLTQSPLEASSESAVSLTIRGENQIFCFELH